MDDEEEEAEEEALEGEDRTAEVEANRASLSVEEGVPPMRREAMLKWDEEKKEEEGLKERGKRSRREGRSESRSASSFSLLPSLPSLGAKEKRPFHPPSSTPADSVYVGLFFEQIELSKFGRDGRLRKA